MPGHTRGFFGASLCSLLVQSTAASGTLAEAATDFGPFFNVGRREVKFLVTMTSAPITSATGILTLTISQGSTNSTANSTVGAGYTVLQDAAGSSATWTISSGTSSTAFEFVGLVSSRYVQARVTGTTSAVVNTYAMSVFALPIVRNG